MSISALHELSSSDTLNETAPIARQSLTPSFGSDHCISANIMDKLQKTLQEQTSAECKPETCIYYGQMLLSAEVGQELLHKFTQIQAENERHKQSIAAQQTEISALILQNEALVSSNHRAAYDLELTRKQMIRLELWLNEFQLARENPTQRPVELKRTTDSSEIMSYLTDAEMEISRVQLINTKLNQSITQMHALHTQAKAERDQALNAVADANHRADQLQAQVQSMKKSPRLSTVLDSVKPAPDPSMEALRDMQVAFNRLSTEHAQLLARFRNLQEELASFQESGPVTAHQEPLSSELARVLTLVSTGTQCSLISDKSMEAEMYALIDSTRNFVSQIQNTDPASIWRAAPTDALWDDLCIKGQELLDETSEQLSKCLEHDDVSCDLSRAWIQVQSCVTQTLLEIVSVQRKVIDSSRAYVKVVGDKDRRSREEPPLPFTTCSPDVVTETALASISRSTGISLKPSLLESFRSRKLFRVF